jgi:hypothetical protein
MVSVSHAAEWLALAVVILLTLALCIGTLKFVSSLLTHERDARESEKTIGAYMEEDRMASYTSPAGSIPRTLAQFVQKCPRIPSCVSHGNLRLHISNLARVAR